MRVGILAVQGAFAEQANAFGRVGAETFEIRQVADLERPFDALVLPGGESTVQGKLLKELGLFDPLKAKIEAGLPVFATCAGMILLAKELEGDPTVWFGVLPIKVRRNAYGRQLGSFNHNGETFIRAPGIVEIGEGVETLTSFNGAATGVRYRNLTAYAWHPELSEDGAAIWEFLLKNGLLSRDDRAKSAV